MDLPLWNTGHIVAVFCVIGNHILSFNDFFGNISDYYIFFLITVEKFEFSGVRSELKIFAIFRSDYG